MYCMHLRGLKQTTQSATTLSYRASNGASEYSSGGGCRTETLLMYNTDPTNTQTPTHMP